jgi:3-oxoacyl-[acyl-carrier-protein] synthase II
MNHKVFVTGLGAVTPNGNTAEETWTKICAGESGIATLQNVDCTDLSVTIGGEVKGFDAKEFLPHVDIRRLSPYIWYSVAAAQQAMQIEPGTNQAVGFDPRRFAVLAATGYGTTEAVHEATRILDARGPRAVSPNVTIYGGADALSSYLGVQYGAMGTTHGISAACATGTVGIGEATRMIRHGYADAVLVVGADDSLNRQDIASTANLRALASNRNDEPARASRPFDRDRSGFVMSSGAAALLLESERSIEKRKSVALAEVAGYGCSSNAYHATAPHPDGLGAEIAMMDALADGNIAPTDIDYINAHGTSTAYNDATELKAISEVFSEHAFNVPISSTKSMTGHLLGAAGALEAIFCVLALRDQIVPPTINLDNSDFPGFDLVPHRARRTKLTTVLSNSFGFGGHNASLILKAVS